MSITEWLEESGARPIVVASHPRSGTHLLIDALRFNFPECRSWKWWGQRLDRLYLNLASLEAKDATLTPGEVRGILRRSRIPLIKTHATADFKWDLVDGALCQPEVNRLAAILRKNARIFYTYRDGRNALCSYFELERHRHAKWDLTFSEFIRQAPFGSSRVREWAQHVRGWSEVSSVFFVSMEELIAFPDVCLPGIAQMLELKRPIGQYRLPPNPSSIMQQRLQRLIRLRPPSTAILHRGEGKTDWRRYFTPADRQFFAAENEGMLVKLGYEDGDDWVDPSNDNARRWPSGFVYSRSSQKENVE